MNTITTLILCLGVVALAQVVSAHYGDHGRGRAYYKRPYGRGYKKGSGRYYDADYGTFQNLGKRYGNLHGRGGYMGLGRGSYGQLVGSVGLRGIYGLLHKYGLLHVLRGASLRGKYDDGDYSDYRGNKHGDYHGDKYGDKHGDKYGDYHGDKYGDKHGDKYGDYHGDKYGDYHGDYDADYYGRRGYTGLGRLLRGRRRFYGNGLPGRRFGRGRFYGGRYYGGRRNSYGGLRGGSLLNRRKYDKKYY